MSEQARVEQGGENSQAGSTDLDTMDAPAGFVVIGDIVGFSERGNAEQRSLVRHLWQFLNSRAELGDGSANGAILNGTGDGALIAFPRIHPKGGLGIHWREVIGMGQDWIAHMKKGDPAGNPPVPAVGLRVGIHKGPFQILNVAALGGRARHGGKQVVGKAPNMCARIVNLGGDGDIIVSEDFVGDWKDGVGEGAASDVRLFDPTLEIPPVWAIVKHGRAIPIRRVRTGAPVPERLADADIVSKRIYETMENIEFDLLDFIAQFGVRIHRNRLNARVSIWAPNRSRAFLTPTDFRWNKQHSYTQRSEVRYSLDGQGSGLLGRAFHLMKPLALNNLPDFETHPDRYVQQLHQRTGLDEDVIRRFSRQARSFFAVPFGLYADRVDGVICVDSPDPLTKIKKGNLREIGLALRMAHGMTLAALWRLRQT